METLLNLGSSNLFSVLLVLWSLVQLAAWFLLLPYLPCLGFKLSTQTEKIGNTMFNFSNTIQFFIPSQCLPIQFSSDANDSTLE